MKHWDGSLLNNGTSNHGSTDAKSLQKGCPWIGPGKASQDIDRQGEECMKLGRGVNPRGRLLGLQEVGKRGLTIK